MKPVNRKEVMLDAFAEGTLNEVTPLTREEAFAKKAMESIPSVMVVNIISRASEGTFTADKTFEDVANHILAGGQVEARRGTSIYWTIGRVVYYCQDFMRIVFADLMSDTSLTLYSAIMHADGTNEWIYKVLPYSE